MNRLREAGVAESTAADVLWHARRSMTAHYSLAQLVELHAALVKIEQPAETWNKSLHTLRLEAGQARTKAEKRRASHPKLTQPSVRSA